MSANPLRLVIQTKMLNLPAVKGDLCKQSLLILMLHVLGSLIDSDSAPQCVTPLATPTRKGRISPQVITSQFVAFYDDLLAKTRQNVNAYGKRFLSSLSTFTN